MDDRWRVLAVLTLARVAMGFQLQVVGSTSAGLRSAFGLDTAGIGLLIGLFLLPGIVVALPSGIIGARLGDRRVVLAGLAVMAFGGATVALATVYPVAIAGRLLAGVGAVLFTVLLSKILTDRFAGKETVLAMAIMLNSFPIGIAIGQFAFPLLADAWGWRVAHVAAACAALCAFVFVATQYRDPPPSGATAPVGLGLGRLSSAEVRGVCFVGVAWAALNGAIVTASGFAPALLQNAGYPTAQGATLLGLTTVLLVVSVQIGGWVGQRHVAPPTLAMFGSIAFGAGLCLATASGFEVVGLGLGYLPGGVGAGALYAMTGSYLRPENRAVGFGLFLTWLHLGFALIPMAAGAAARLSGHTSAALLLAGALVIASVVPLLFLRSSASPKAAGGN